MTLENPIFAIIDLGTQLLQKLGLESQLLGFGQSEQSEQFEQSEYPIIAILDFQSQLLQKPIPSKSESLRGQKPTSSNPSHPSNPSRPGICALTKKIPQRKTGLGPQRPIRLFWGGGRCDGPLILLFFRKEAIPKKRGQKKGDPPFFYTDGPRSPFF